MVGKFFAEAVEHVDTKPVKAAFAAGATRCNHHAGGVAASAVANGGHHGLPLEYNFRASTVVGAVGAGGIGTELIGRFVGQRGLDKARRKPRKADVACAQNVRAYAPRVSAIA